MPQNSSQSEHIFELTPISIYPAKTHSLYSFVSFVYNIMNRGVMSAGTYFGAAGTGAFSGGASCGILLEQE